MMIDGGMNLVMGLAAGIRAGISSAVSAAIEMAMSVVNATTSTLKIRSPSQVMHKLGAQTRQGFTGGLEGDPGRTQDAVLSMVAPPQPRQLAAAAGEASAGSGGGPSGRVMTVNFHDGAIRVGNGDRSEVKRGMLEAWEEIALELGLQPST
jgi:hypothetical protein